MGKKAKLKAQRRESNLRARRYTEEVAAIQLQRRYADRLNLAKPYFFHSNPVIVDCQSIYDSIASVGGTVAEWDAGIYDRFAAHEDEWPVYLKGTSLNPPYRRMFFELKFEGQQFGAFLTMDADDDFSICTYTIEQDEVTGYEILDCETGEIQCYLTTQGELAAADVNPFGGGIDCRVVMFVCLKTLQFLNCRNIELVAREPDHELSRLHEKHYGIPLLKYKVLGIKPVGKRSESGEPKEYQDLMPLHLRRGHFATYTDDAPLFGKYTGTFWRPATVVGSEDNGVVVKDYKVDAQ